jgi:hypothetical protein
MSDVSFNIRTVRRSPVKVRRLIEKKVNTSFSTYREIILTGGFLGFANQQKSNPLVAEGQGAQMGD